MTITAQQKRWLKKQVHHLAHDLHATVTVHLDHVFTSVRMRSFHDHGQNLVDGTTVRVPQVAQIEAVRYHPVGCLSRKNL